MHERIEFRVQDFSSAIAEPVTSLLRRSCNARRSLSPSMERAS